MGARKFLFSKTVQTDSQAHPASSSMGTGVLFQACEVDHSSPSSAAFKHGHTQLHLLPFYLQTIICTVLKCDIGTSTWRTHYCFTYGSVTKGIPEPWMEPTGLHLNTLGMKNNPFTFPFPQSSSVTA